MSCSTLCCPANADNSKCCCFAVVNDNLFNFREADQFREEQKSMSKCCSSVLKKFSSENRSVEFAGCFDLDSVDRISAEIKSLSCS